MKRDIRSIASVILLVSLSADGADRLAEPKLLSNRAKKRFSTCFATKSTDQSVHKFGKLDKHLLVYLSISKLKREICTTAELSRTQEKIL